MNTTIATTLRRMLSLPALLVILTLAVSWLTAAVAHAQPNGPDDIEEPGGDISATLILQSRCSPTTGFDYVITPHNVPAGHDVVLVWREQGTNNFHNAWNELSGTVASGLGKFEARVVIHDQPHVPFIGEWQPVEVRCDVREPEPSVSVDVEPVCDPEAGLSYTVTGHDLPEDPDYYKFHWRPTNKIPFQFAEDQSGIVASGEGDFEVRGVMVYDGDTYYTDWVEVTADCRTPDDIVPGDPNFTG